jgi:hypothetical protein
MKAKSAKTKTETNPTATVKASTTTSHVTTDSQWAGVGPAVPAATSEHVTRTSLRHEAADTANIRQVGRSAGQEFPVYADRSGAVRNLRSDSRHNV